MIGRYKGRLSPIGVLIIEEVLDDVIADLEFSTDTDVYNILYSVLNPWSADIKTHWLLM